MDEFEELSKVALQLRLALLSRWKEHWEDYRYPSADIPALLSEINSLAMSAELSAKLKVSLEAIKGVARLAIERRLDVQISSD